MYVLTICRFPLESLTMPEMQQQQTVGAWEELEMDIPTMEKPAPNKVVMDTVQWLESSIQYYKRCDYNTVNSTA